MNRILALVLLAGVMFVDGYDLSAMPLAVPHLIAEYGLAPQEFGLVLSAAIAGIGLGALLLGPLGDRFGRRPVLTISIAALGLTTLATITTTTIAGFAAWRLLTGLMLGMALPNATALTSEMAPEGRKAAVLTLVSSSISLGAMTAGFIATPLVAAHGWRGLFVIPGLLTLVLALALWFVIPSGVAPRDARQPNAFAALLRRPLIVPLATFAALYAINAMAVYGLNSWVPTIFPRAGLPVSLGAKTLGLMQGGGLIGGLVLSALLDRLRPVRVFAVAYGLVIVALVALWLVPPAPMPWTWLIFVAGGGVSAAHVALMAVAVSRFFPKAVLSSAIGLGVAIARLGAIAGPMGGSWLIGAGLSPATILLAFVVPVAICAALTRLMPLAEAKGRAAQVSL